MASVPFTAFFSR